MEAALSELAHAVREQARACSDEAAQCTQLQRDLDKGADKQERLRRTLAAVDQELASEAGVEKDLVVLVTARKSVIVDWDAKFKTLKSTIDAATASAVLEVEQLESLCAPWQESLGAERLQAEASFLNAEERLLSAKLQRLKQEAGSMRAQHERMQADLAETRSTVFRTWQERTDRAQDTRAQQALLEQTERSLASLTAAVHAEATQAASAGSPNTIQRFLLTPASDLAARAAQLEEQLEGFDEDAAQTRCCIAVLQHEIAGCLQPAARGLLQNPHNPQQRHNPQQQQQYPHNPHNQHQYLHNVPPPPLQQQQQQQPPHPTPPSWTAAGQPSLPASRPHQGVSTAANQRPQGPGTGAHEAVQRQAWESHKPHESHESHESQEPIMDTQAMPTCSIYTVQEPDDESPDRDDLPQGTHATGGGSRAGVGQEDHDPGHHNRQHEGDRGAWQVALHGSHQQQQGQQQQQQQQAAHTRPPPAARHVPIMTETVVRHTMQQHNGKRVVMVTERVTEVKSTLQPVALNTPSWPMSEGSQGDAPQHWHRPGPAQQPSPVPPHPGPIRPPPAPVEPYTHHPGYNHSDEQHERRQQKQYPPHQQQHNAFRMPPYAPQQQARPYTAASASPAAAAAGAGAATAAYPESGPARFGSYPFAGHTRPAQPQPNVLPPSRPYPPAPQVTQQGMAQQPPQQQAVFSAADTRRGPYQPPPAPYQPSSAPHQPAPAWQAPAPAPTRVPSPAAQHSQPSPTWAPGPAGNPVPPAPTSSFRGSAAQVAHREGVGERGVQVAPAPPVLADLRRAASGPLSGGPGGSAGTAADEGAGDATRQRAGRGGAGEQRGGRAKGAGKRGRGAGGPTAGRPNKRGRPSGGGEAPVLDPFGGSAVYTPEAM